MLRPIMNLWKRAMSHEPRGDRPLVVLVGHCGFDASRLASAVRDAGAHAHVVDTQAELESSLPGAALVLVNRVLDGRFADRCGLGLIRRLGAAAGAHEPRIMLVSNFPEAQAEARAAGALPGFGKDDLSGGRASEAIRSALTPARAR